MTENADSAMSAPAAPSRSIPKWVPWAGMGLVVVTLVLLAAVGPTRLLSLLTPSYHADKPLSLTILNTNDTWGYVYPCG